MTVSGTEFGAWVTAGTLVVTTVMAQLKTSKELKSQRGEIDQRKADADALQRRPDVDMAKQAFEAMKNLADSYEEEIKRRDMRDKQRDERDESVARDLQAVRLEVFSLKTILNKNGISYSQEEK